MTKTTEQKVVKTQNIDEVFPIIDPRELVGHKLLNHVPKTGRQRYLLNLIQKGIKMKLPAFRAPIMDPSEENGKIVFKSGNKPAIGYSAVWWDETWKKFMPSKNSRSGTDLQRAAFLGKQMKCLIEDYNYSVEEAWKAMCDDSCDLGHYKNSKDTKHELEPTGSRKVGEYFDLGNTRKFVKKSGYSYFLYAGGDYKLYSIDYPLVSLYRIINPNVDYFCSVGWLVLDV